MSIAGRRSVAHSPPAHQSGQAFHQPFHQSGRPPSEPTPASSTPLREPAQPEKARNERSTAARPVERAGSPVLFVNGRFFTADPARPAVEALLVHDGGILAAGDAAELRRMRPDAAAVDLAGRFVCPGFVDAHNHFSLTALAPVEVDCRPPPVRSMTDLLAAVHAAAQRMPPGRFLRGHGYDDAALGG